MTVREMIEILGGMDQDAEVRLAIQPRYPFEHGVGDIVETPRKGFDSVVYIGESGQIGYLPEDVTEELNW